MYHHPIIIVLACSICACDQYYVERICIYYLYNTENEPFFFILFSSSCSLVAFCRPSFACYWMFVAVRSLLLPVPVVGASGRAAASSPNFVFLCFGSGSASFSTTII